jgi:hypothetical protein
MSEIHSLVRDGGIWVFEAQSRIFITAKINYVRSKINISFQNLLTQN